MTFIICSNIYYLLLLVLVFSIVRTEPSAPRAESAEFIILNTESIIFDTEFITFHTELIIFHTESIICNTKFIILK